MMGKMPRAGQTSQREYFAHLTAVEKSRANKLNVQMFVLCRI